jgi:hypothetical protein
MDMDTLAQTVAAILQRHHGWRAPRIWVGLMTTPTGWYVEIARGYACVLPSGTTPLPYDTTRYRSPYDAFDAALRAVWDQIEAAEANRRGGDDEEEEA